MVINQTLPKNKVDKILSTHGHASFPRLIMTNQLYNSSKLKSVSMMMFNLLAPQLPFSAQFCPKAVLNKRSNWCQSCKLSAQQYSTITSTYSSSQNTCSSKQRFHNLLSCAGLHKAYKIWWSKYLQKVLNGQRAVDWIPRFFKSPVHYLLSKKQ